MKNGLPVASKLAYNTGRAAQILRIKANDCSKF
jgi:hypothetical protein